MPFRNKSKKYWIIPDQALSPDDLKLGHVLKRPNNVIDMLNRLDLEPIDESDILIERERVSKSINDAISNGFGVNLEVSSALAALIGCSPNIDVGWSRGNGGIIEATGVRAKHFMPSEEYINKALKKKCISDYVTQSFFTAPIYMVLGVTVANSVTRNEIKSRNIHLKGGAGASIPGTEVGVSIDLSINHDSKLETNESVEDSLVLAYRVRRFRYSKRREKFDSKDEDESEHARYGLGEEDLDSDQEEHNYVAQFSYFADEDIDASDVGLAGFAEDDEDDYSSGDD